MMPRSGKVEITTTVELFKEIDMMWYTRWKAKRELRKVAKLIEELAHTLPSSSLQAMFPDLKTHEARNCLLDAARIMRHV